MPYFTKCCPIVKVHYILVIFTLVQNEEKKERLKKKAKVGQNVGGKAMTGELEGGADLNICCRPPYCSEITPLQRTSALQTLHLIAVK